LSDSPVLLVFQSLLLDTELCNVFGNALLLSIKAFEKTLWPSLLFLLQLLSSRNQSQRWLESFQFLRTSFEVMILIFDDLK
jgi:hypothetical protein